MKSLAPLAAFLIVGCHAGVSSVAPVPPKATHPSFDPAASQRQIDARLMQVKGDPEGALGWSMLAESYLALASETDDDIAAEKAEQAARKSLLLRRNRNEAAASLLGRALLAQHRFEDAYKEVAVASTESPENESLRRLRMEIQLELGLYDEFRQGLNDLKRKTDPASLVVRARWEGLSGRPEEEVKILTAAVQEVDSIMSLPASTVAWYRLQLAAALLRKGDHQLSEQELDRAYALHPESYQVCAWQTRFAAETGDATRVLAWAEKTLKIARMTDIEGHAIQALRKLGRPKEAKVWLEEMKKENLKNGQSIEDKPGHTHSKAETRHTHDRLFAMALANLGEHPAFAHHAAEEDLEGRKDIYAYDAFAWATYRYWKLVPPSVTGEGDQLLREAESAIAKALSTGSKDPHLLYHAGKIFQKSQPDRAAKLLGEALRISPNVGAFADNL